MGVSLCYVKTIEHADTGTSVNIPLTGPNVCHMFQGKINLGDPGLTLGSVDKIFQCLLSSIT